MGIHRREDARRRAGRTAGVRLVVPEESVEDPLHCYFLHDRRFFSYSKKRQYGETSTKGTTHDPGGSPPSLYA